LAGGQDHLAGAGLDVPSGVGAGAEPAGRLDHDLGAQLVPRRRARVSLRRDVDPPPRDEERAIHHFDRIREAPVDGVQGEQMGERRRVGDVVDGDDLQVGAPLDSGAQDGATDPAEAVDGDSSWHRFSLTSKVRSSGSGRGRAGTRRAGRRRARS
jgi:hypothetical protein